MYLMTNGFFEFPVTSTDYAGICKQCKEQDDGFKPDCEGCIVARRAFDSA